MNQPNSSSANGNNHRPAVDVLDDNPQSSNALYDSSNPLLAPPKHVDETKQKSRKRKLIILCFVFVFMAGSAFALHRLLKINQVNVKPTLATMRRALKLKKTPKGRTITPVSRRLDLRDKRLVQIARQTMAQHPRRQLLVRKRIRPNRQRLGYAV
jgi:hypothetical protein